MKARWGRFNQRIGFSFLLFTLVPVHAVARAQAVTGTPANPAQRAEAGFTRQGERELAVMEGLTWMAAFLTIDRNFLNMPIDSFRIFREVALTTDNPYTRQWAETTAYVMGQNLRFYYLSCQQLSNRGILEMLDFICNKDQYKHIDFVPLIEKTRMNFQAFPNTEALLDIPYTHLEDVNESDLFKLLIRAYSIEKARIVFSGQFEADIQLIDVLRFIQRKKLVSYEEDPSEDKGLWQDHCYLATHVAYVFNNYGELRLIEEDVPTIYRYVRANFPYALLRNDVELVGEFVDVLRGFGYTEEGDPMVRQGTEYLLDCQHDDGSWSTPIPGKKQDPYHRLHPTWCAVVGLRSRFFYQGSPYHKRIQAIIEELKKE